MDLQKGNLVLAFLNLFILTLPGVLLRGASFLPFPFNYKYLLHAHSHFAFGGWLMPVLIWLVIQYLPSMARKVGIHHWRIILLLVHLSAYGMLFSFPFQGYAAISISFSTLSIIAGFWLAVVLWRASAEHTVPHLFLRAGLFFLCLSSLGAFATGPVIAMGKAGSPMYFNCIYFFLHFQYNGWFIFTVLAVIMKNLEPALEIRIGKRIFYLFAIACIPAYFLSVLWNHPPTLFYFISGAAAFLQLCGLIYLFRAFPDRIRMEGFPALLYKLAMIAFTLKIVLQLLSSFPLIADMAVQYRTVIVAYLHLVLIGFVTFASFAFILKSVVRLNNASVHRAVLLFVTAFLATELLMVLPFVMDYFDVRLLFMNELLFFFSLFYPVSALWMVIRVYKATTVR